MPTRKPQRARKPRLTSTGAPEPTASQRIIQATETLLFERGIDGVSMGDVAAHAGVDKSLVFYYFGTKAELIETVLDGYYTAHQTALASAFEAGGALPERVHRVIDAYFSFIETHRLYPRLVQAEISRSDVNTTKIRDSLAGLCRWTESALAGVAPATGPLAAKHLFLSLSGIMINYFTYAPVLGPFWGEDPMSESARAERRAHVHWIADALLERLIRG